MKDFRSKGVGRQAHAEGARSLLSTPSGLDACDRTFSIDPVVLVNKLSLSLPSTEPSAAAKCATAAPAVGRDARHIHGPYSCQDHPAGLWSTAAANGPKAAGRSPVTDSREISLAQAEGARSQNSAVALSTANTGLTLDKKGLESNLPVTAAGNRAVRSSEAAGRLLNVTS